MLIKILIDASALSKEMFKDVLFFSVAVGGAMGVPGEMIVVNSIPAVYVMNSIFGDVDVREVERLFPVLAKCRFKVFGFDSEVPEGWNYVNLGMINHLIVADKVYDDFIRLTKDCGEDYQYYAAWKDAAAEITGLKTDDLMSDKKCW